MIDLTNELTVNLLREYSKRSLYNFFKLVWEYVETVEFVDNWHIEYICNILQDRQIKWELYGHNTYTEEDLADILINICPSASKSLIISVVFPCWCLLRVPTMKILNVTYSYSLSEKLSGKRLRLITSDLYMKLVKFKLKNQSLAYVENTKSGSIYATSATGSIVGNHFDLIIVDDGNSTAAINSEASRNEAKRLVKEILPSRKTNVQRSYSVYVQQRLHNEDISGTLLEQKNGRKLKHIIIPAINENGESFFPARFPLSFFEQQRETLGTTSFMAQYQQVTQDESGGIIKKEWINEILGDNERELTYFIDTAYGNKNGGDTDDNAIIGCYKDGQNMIIQFAERNKKEFPELLHWLKTNIPNYATVYIEGKASGKSVIQMLRQSTNLNVIEVQPQAGKIETKHTCSPFFESGRIFINKYINNKELLIQQITFENLKHDDLSDCVMMAINNFLKKTEISWSAD